MNKVTVPEGQSGRWRVERFHVSEVDAIRANLAGVTSDILNCDRNQMFESGTFTKLIYFDEDSKLHTVMSDTTKERNDHQEFVDIAFGRVLVNGLGIGVVIQALLEKSTVTSVHVVEKEKDVINLVADHYKARFGDRFVLHHASAFDFKPRGHYSFVWNDIWPDISDMNIPEMEQLKKKYEHRCSWQGCWAEEECRKMAAIIHIIDQHKAGKISKEQAHEAVTALRGTKAPVATDSDRVHIGMFNAFVEVFACPNCGNRLSVSREKTSALLTCTECGAKIVCASPAVVKELLREG